MHTLFLIFSPKNNVSESIKYLKMKMTVCGLHSPKEIQNQEKNPLFYHPKWESTRVPWLHREAPLLSFGLISSCCWRPGIALRGRLVTTASLHVLCLPVHSQLTLFSPSCRDSCGRIALQNQTLTWLGLSGKEKVSGFVYATFSSRSWFC